MAWNCLLCPRISFLTLNLLLTHLSSSHQHDITNLKRKVDQCLDNAGYNVDSIPGYNDLFEDIFQTSPDVVGSLDNLECKKGYKDIPYVGPQKIVLGSHKAIKKIQKKKKIVTVEDVFYYISLLETLKIQLSSANILEMVMNPREPNENIYQDYCDGTFVTTHELFSCDDTSLKLIFYFDDVNLNNPLTNKVHKISFFYYQIGNIAPQYRSKLKSIQLLAICKTSLLKKYGINAIFKPLVKELKILETDHGYPFPVFDGVFHLRGTAFLFLADTPASQQAGGYKESVGGAFRKCRNCMATYDDMQEHFCEEEFMLRNKERREQQLDN